MKQFVEYLTPQSPVGLPHTPLFDEVKQLQLHVAYTTCVTLEKDPHLHVSCYNM